jgi:hypothetical protein
MHLRLSWVGNRILRQGKKILEQFWLYLGSTYAHVWIHIKYVEEKINQVRSMQNNGMEINKID